MLSPLSARDEHFPLSPDLPPPAWQRSVSGVSQGATSTGSGPQPRDIEAVLQSALKSRKAGGTKGPSLGVLAKAVSRFLQGKNVEEWDSEEEFGEHRDWHVWEESRRGSSDPLADSTPSHLFHNHHHPQHDQGDAHMDSHPAAITPFVHKQPKEATESVFHTVAMVVGSTTIRKQDAEATIARQDSRWLPNLVKIFCTKFNIAPNAAQISVVAGSESGYVVTISYKGAQDDVIAQHEYERFAIDRVFQGWHAGITLKVSGFIRLD